MQARIAVVVVIACALSGTARAHFILQAPASNFQEDLAGDPQKSAPCGQADPNITPVPTNAITGVDPGGQLTITVDEVIFHPGHYRVAIAPDMASLPADPMFDAACNPVAVQNPPVLPIIADNMLSHTAAFSGPQSFTVTIPSDPGCTSCTLQVIEFMLDHGGNSCFYHHCAALNVMPGAGAGNDAGTGGGNPAQHSGCSAGGGAGLPIALVLALAAIPWRRRRR